MLSMQTTRHPTPQRVFVFALSTFPPPPSNKKVTPERMSTESRLCRDIERREKSKLRTNGRRPQQSFLATRTGIRGSPLFLWSENLGSDNYAISVSSLLSLFITLCWNLHQGYLQRARSYITKQSGRILQNNHISSSGQIYPRRCFSFSILPRCRAAGMTAPTLQPGGFRMENMMHPRRSVEICGAQLIVLMSRLQTCSITQASLSQMPQSRNTIRFYDSV